MKRKVIEKTPEGELERIKEYTEKIFREIFKGREKAKQRVVYNLLNCIKTNNRAQFLSEVLKLLASIIENEDVKKLINIVNDIWVKYDSPENFEKLGYTIIMGIMS